MKPLVMWENGTSRRGAGNTATALTHPSDLSGRRAGVSLPSKRRGPRPDRRPIGECAVEGCDGPKRLQARGLCAKHYHRWNRHGDALAYRRTVRPEGCAVEGCGEPNYCRDWCVTHYSRWIEHGTTDDPRPPACAAPSCETATADGYCFLHRRRLERHGQLGLPARDRYIHSHGYVVVKSEAHPLSQADGWVYEHRLVLFDEIGPGVHPCNWCGTSVSWDRSYPLHDDALVVDHLDDSRDNNSPENLVPSCAVCNLARGQKRRRAAA